MRSESSPFSDFSLLNTDTRWHPRRGHSVPCVLLFAALVSICTAADLRVETRSQESMESPRVVEGAMTTFGTVATLGFEHGIGVTKGCAQRCVGEAMYCTNTFHFMDDFDDAIVILEVWDIVHSGAGDVRVPASGSLPIVRIMGNAKCTDAGGVCDVATGAHCTLPCLLADSASVIEGLPGFPDSGRVRFAQSQYVVTEEDPTPLGDTVFFTWRDRCNSDAMSCPIAPLTSPAGSSTLAMGCDDGNDCTLDLCSDGGCTNEPECVVDADCDDGDACSEATCTDNGCCDRTPLPRPACDVLPADASICDGESAWFCASSGGGTSDVTIVWKKGDEILATCTPTDLGDNDGECCVEVSEEGTYAAGVADAASCESECEATLSVRECSCRVTGGGVDGKIPPNAWVEGEDGQNRYTFGGQAGAPSAAPAWGEWTHRQQRGSAGKFTFHGGTASAPSGTGIENILCHDADSCDPARTAPNKQIEFSGVGIFKNIRGAKTPVSFDWGAVAGGTLHWFEVHIEDLGEPGNFDASYAGCPPDGHQDLFPPASCGCPDYYRLTIFETGDRDAPGAVIYEVGGYIDGGNLQIHPPID